MRERPNIVFVTTDTQGREMVSSYVRRAGVDTPQIDRLAAEGVRFENAVTACPTCTPARSAWYTGVFPNRNGAMGNGLAVSRKVPMLAEVLRGSGYRTHHVGKWHLDAAGYSGAGVADGGFEASTWYELENFYDEVGRDGPNRFGGWNRGLEEIEYCFAHRVANRAVDIIQQERRSRKDRTDSRAPLFLAVELDEPHGPYICPPPYRDRLGMEDIYVPPTANAELSGKPRLQQDYAEYLRSVRGNPDSIAGYYPKYYNCNSYADYELGRIFDAVQEHLGENTVIIYTSDHGDHLGAFGLGPKGPTMYDHTIAVPLIVWSPKYSQGKDSRGKFLGGRVVNEPVGATDIWATIVELAAGAEALDSCEPTAGYDGHSLVPCLEGKQTHERDAAFVEYNRFGIKFDQCDGFYPIRCVRTQRWKLAVNLFDRDELYALEEDPYEATNRIDDPALATVRNELHDRLLEWQGQTWDLLRGPQWRDRPWRDLPRREFVGLTTTGAKEQWEAWEWVM